MVDAARARKLAGRIKQIVATGIETQIKDPRLGMVTITDVRVSGDLHDATVFYTVFGDDEAHRESAVALDSAKGVLRSEVGRQTGVRFTPTLSFVLDAVPEGQRVMLKLSLPTEVNFYRSLIEHPKVMRVVALSGGYSREEANELLAKNTGLIASFSRALTEGLSVDQSDEQFDATLDKAIQSIYDASVAG